MQLRKFIQSNFSFSNSYQTKRNLQDPGTTRNDKTQSASPGSLLEAFAHTIDARSAVASKDFRHRFPKTVPITVTCTPVQWCAGRKRASDQVRILHAHICGQYPTVTEMYKAR